MRFLELRLDEDYNTSLHSFDDAILDDFAEYELDGLDVFILDEFVNDKDLNCEFLCSKIGCVIVFMLFDEDIHNSSLLLIFKSSSLHS